MTRQKIKLLVIAVLSAQFLVDQYSEKIFISEFDNRGEQ